MISLHKFINILKTKKNNRKSGNKSTILLEMCFVAYLYPRFNKKNRYTKKHIPSLNVQKRSFVQKLPFSGHSKKTVVPYNLIITF